MRILSRPNGPEALPGLAPAMSDAPIQHSAANAPHWGYEQVWLHPDPEMFRAGADVIASVLEAHLLALPPRISAGPLGCATPWNVREFLRDGQPDRAWRLAARLMLAARAKGLPTFAGQVADDLAVSALLLAGEVHGCAFGLLEAACVVGRLTEAAAAGVLVYPELPSAPDVLMQIFRARRLAVLERAARRMAVDGVSPASSEALMWRGPPVGADEMPVPTLRR